MYLSKNVVGSFIWEFDMTNKQLDVMPETEVKITMGDGDASYFTVYVSQIPTVEESAEEVTELGSGMEETNLESGFAPEDVVVVDTPEVETEPATEMVEETTEVDTEPETEATTVEVPAGTIYTLAGKDGNKRATVMTLNGRDLVLGENNELPDLSGYEIIYTKKQ